MKRTLLFAGSILLLGVVTVAVYAIVLTSRTAQGVLTPPTLPLDRTPAELGFPDYREVSFAASDGVRLRGWYIPPRPGNEAAVVLAHGYAQNRQQMLPEAAILAARGYGVLLFDFRGHGESDRALVTLGDHERRDLEAAIDFCAARPEISTIGGLGFSMGGATLAQVAAYDERLSAVVIVAAYPTLAQEIRYRARSLGPLSQLPALRAIRKAGVDVRDVRPIDDLCAISPRPLLLIYGQTDADVPPGAAQRMIDAACQPAELWIVAEAGHQSLAEVVPEQYDTRLIGFFRSSW